LINRRVKRPSPGVVNRAQLFLGTTEDDRNLTLLLFMLYFTSVIVTANRMKQGIIMKKAIFMFVLIFLLFLSPLLPQEDKMMVIAVRAGIYLDPDLESPIIETVKGELFLISSRKKRYERTGIIFLSTLKKSFSTSQDLSMCRQLKRCMKFLRLKKKKNRQRR